MSRLTRKNQPSLRRLVKQKNPTILKKFAIAFAIVLVAISVYTSYLAPHTLEAKQRIQLEGTQQQLLQTKLELEKQKTTDAKQDAEKQKQIEEIQKKYDETQKQLQAKRSMSSSTVAYAAPVSSGSSNEDQVWSFLVGHGFSRVQAAGIMGNLKQEHNFNTSDVPGGLGIAQWIGGRRANLIARGNYLDLNVQLQFLLDELNGVEGVAGNAIRASQTVEGATVAFQNNFERCGVCREDTRIQYAYQILARH